MLLAVDVGNTQTHFGTFQDGELVEHWRFATIRTMTADELGATLRNLVELRGVGLADLTASILSSTVPALEPEWTRMARRYLDHEPIVVGPACARGWRCATTTRARSAPTGSSTPWRSRSAGAARPSASTSGPP
jgi:type III pantothenate kinase